MSWIPPSLAPMSRHIPPHLFAGSCWSRGTEHQHWSGRICRERLGTIIPVVQAAGITHAIQWNIFHPQQKDSKEEFLSCIPSQAAQSLPQKSPSRWACRLGWSLPDKAQPTPQEAEVKSCEYPQICKPAGSPVLQTDSSSAPTENLCVLLDSEVWEGKLSPPCPGLDPWASQDQTGKK